MLSRTPARAGLLAVAVALIAVLVAAPGAGAATFSGGPFKIDFKTLANAKKLKVSTSGADPKTKTGGTFELGTGQLTMVDQASGNIGVGTSTSSITFTLGKKKAVLTSMTQKLTAGKGQLNAVINGRGKAVTLFDQASQGKIKPAADFATLTMSTSNMQLTKSGAAALNKAFGLTAPKRGQKDQRLKAKQKVGTAGFTADRSLTVIGGESRTVYDPKFVQDLRNCDIELGSVAPATAIPKDSSAPEGGVNLPINAANGGTLTASGLIGEVRHQGGTVLNRPPGKPKPAYNSEITNFVFTLGNPPFALNAFIKNINNSTVIGTVTGDLNKNLTADAGAVTLSGGALVLSEQASGTLSSSAPPLGADCPIPPGSKIGAVTMTANVS